MSEWTLSYGTYDPDAEGLREALCTLGNGYFATRGAAPESHADGIHYPGTYVSGLYNRLRTDIGGRQVENEDLVNCPNWLPLEFRIEDGPWFSVDQVHIEEYRQEVDLRRAVLRRHIRFVDESGRTTTVSQRRFVHMGNRHLAALETTIESHDWHGKLEVVSAIDGTVGNRGVSRYSDLASKHLESVAETTHDDMVLVRVRTSQSRIEIAVGARTRVYSGGERLHVERAYVSRCGYAAHGFVLDLSPGSPVTIEKMASLFTSRDRAVADAESEALQLLERARGFEEVLRFHEESWEHLWNRFRIEVSGPERPSLIMNLHILHLLQSASMHSIDLDVGVPARGWTGEAYRGHVFWDELFILPFINLHQPEITRALLQYRYRRLDEARAASFVAGFSGAMFPWQSGSNGREETQVMHLNPRSGEWIPDNSHRQRHISSAVAYNIWQYYQATGDRDFLSFYGAEMILEIARFWASIATYNEAEDRFEIKGVMGPDEYHDGYPWDETPRGIDNNAYTNIMAVWVLLRAIDVLELLPLYRRLELTSRLRMESEEIDYWETISSRMKICFHDSDIVSQFEGYGRLDEFDWAGYKTRYGQIHRLDRILGAEGDTPNRYKLSKQADVLMLFYLFSAEELSSLFCRLGYEMSADMIARNVSYYEARTAHGSTLSGVVAAWVLARTDKERSWELLCEALESDIADVQGGTTAEGIHLGAMAGTVDIVQRAYVGIEMRDDVLRLDPALPANLEEVRLHIRYRGQWLDLEVRANELVALADAAEGRAIKLAVGEVEYDVVPGSEIRVALA